jgi:hypothetical protein
LQEKADLFLFPIQLRLCQHTLRAAKQSGDTNVFSGPRNEVDQFEMKSTSHEVRYGYGAEETL